MMQQKVTRLNCYFEEQIAACSSRNQALLADDRADEAVFEKVRANIYDVFRTVLFAGVKACKGEEDAVRSFFIQRLEQIPSGWAAAYEAAKRNDDPVKMQIERIKLDTVEEIRETFAKIWEGEA